MLTPDMVTGASLTCDELCSASGLSEAELAGLQSFGLIEPVIVAGIPTFDEDALTVANLAADFRKFGIEPRHLRMYRTGVDREIGLIEQVIIPLLRQRNPESRQRATRRRRGAGDPGSDHAGHPVAIGSASPRRGLITQGPSGATFQSWSE